MKKIGLIYWSGTGNTESMANHLKKQLECCDVDLYFSEISEMDEDAFFENEMLIMGSPACGTEQINEDYFEPLMEDSGDKFEGKNVFLFGTYGWGGGEYMETWTEDLLSHGAKIEFDAVVVEGEPSDETFEELTTRAQQIAEYEDCG